MLDNKSQILEEKFSALESIKQDLFSYDSKSIVLFGSMSAYLKGKPLFQNPGVFVTIKELGRFREPDPNKIPNDIDMLYVGNDYPSEVLCRDYGCKLELLVFKESQLVGLAKSLRYDPKFLSFVKMNFKSKFECRGARAIKYRIAAALLLGSDYEKFGIKNRKVIFPDGLVSHPLILPRDRRDYSEHTVIYGDNWWRQVQEYAQDRRGPKSFLRDLIDGTYKFEIC